jgi:hypothetical protein
MARNRLRNLSSMSRADRKQTLRSMPRRERLAAKTSLREGRLRRKGRPGFGREVRRPGTPYEGREMGRAIGGIPGMASLTYSPGGGQRLPEMSGKLPGGTQKYSPGTAMAPKAPAMAWRSPGLAPGMNFSGAIQSAVRKLRR